MENMVMAIAAQVVERLSPEHIAAFKGLSAEALLGLCFFAFLTVVMPVAVYFIARAYVKSMRAMADAFMHALDKRDEDQKKIVEMLDKMGVSIDKRLIVLERKVDRIVPLDVVI